MPNSVNFNGYLEVTLPSAGNSQPGARNTIPFCDLDVFVTSKLQMCLIDCGHVLNEPNRGNSYKASNGVIYCSGNEICLKDPTFEYLISLASCILTPADGVHIKLRDHVNTTTQNKQHPHLIAGDCTNLYQEVACPSSRHSRQIDFQTFPAALDAFVPMTTHRLHQSLR